MLSVSRSDFEQEWRFHSAVRDLILAKAKQRSGRDWDWDAWERVLGPAEFDLLLLGHVIGVWENNGRFIDTIKCWEEELDRVDRAFRRLGFNVASVLMPRALELDSLQGPYLHNELPLPDDLAAEIERVNNAATADVSEERLTRVISQRAAELDL